MERQLLKLCITGELTELAHARQAMTAALKAGNQPNEIVSPLILCFSEIATNAIEHGGATRLGITLTLHSDQLSLAIVDNGKRLSYDYKLCDDKPDGDKPTTVKGQAKGQDVSQAFDLEQENGRGLDIISSLAEGLSSHYDELSHENRVALTWKIKPLDKRRCVLLVDDDRSLTALYESYLAENYRVLVANSGQRAIEILPEQHVDIVISDINMPEMNGITLRKIIGENEKTASIPFIFLTMDDNVDTSNHAIHLGIDDYLLKPVTRQSLINTIERVISHYCKLSQTLNTRVNQEISSALTPSLPAEIFGWKLALASRNTGAGGGDLVVYHKTQNAAYIAVIDVMGHNDTAKFFSYAYAGYLKGAMLALKEEQVPCTLLENLSQQIYADTLLGQTYLTCCIVKISHNGSVEIASAGHPPSYLIPRRPDDKRLIPLDDAGMMLGLLPTQKYYSQALEALPGDRVALYTDGLLEGAINQQERLQLETAMIESFSLSQNMGLDESLQYSLQLLDKHTNYSPHDDALLILMEKIH